MAQASTSNFLPLDFYEGRVGSIFEKEQVFVTTPNAEVIFDPLHGVRSIHLRKNNHFGLEDPLYFPQPFSLAQPHLALIPLPSTDRANIFFMCWYLPTHNDFEWVNPEDESGSSTGLGLFKKDLRVQLRGTVSRLTDRLATMDHSCLSQDKYMKNYNCSLPWLLAQLNSACSFSRALRTFGLIQRISLERGGRADWLVNYAHHWEYSDIIRTGLETAHTVGALAGNLEVAQHLFNLGIPVWLVRKLKEKGPDLRVLKWIDAPDATESLSLRTGGFQLSFEELNPPNSVVWTGKISTSNFDRYEKMSLELRKAAMAHLYEEETRASEVDAEASSSSTALQASTSSATGKPPKKRRRLEAQAPPPPPPTTRVKFKEVEANIMPQSLAPWKQASESVGEHFNPNAYHSPLGYFLPDPQMIAVCGLESGNYSTRTAYITVWLKLRHVLCYRLRTSSVSPLGPSRWRTVLGIEKMPFKEKKAAKQKEEVEQMLMDILKNAGNTTSVDLARLDTARVEWNGSLLEVGTAPQIKLQEILWELFELGFRYELLVMDRRFYGGSQPREEREPELLISLMRHWKGSFVPADLEEGRTGFAATDLLERRMAIWGFLLVMDGWKDAGQLPTSLHKSSAIRKRIDVNETQTSETTTREVDEIEYVVAHHYISCFATTFGRAPTIPHRLS